MLILAPCWRSTAVWLVIIGLAGFPAVAAEEVVETLAEQLRQGQLAEAERFLQQHLVADPEHAEARFALGVVHLFSAVERLGQDQYRYGAMGGTVRNLPVLRVPVPVNPDLEPVTYDQVRQLFADFHLMDFPLREPRRMESARQHFLKMIRTSRESWKLILAETDNDREWLPNPNQTGALGIPVTGPLIDGWHDVLVEMEDLLEGRKLVPFWRDYSGWFGSVAKIPEQGRGVNLKRFFSEPGDFDLVMLIQGTAALPYVEQGTLSRPETWRNLTRVFGGQFFGFAVWFN